MSRRIAESSNLGRMIRKVVQPQVPELLANLPFGRIAMLVECFKVAEYAREFVTAAPEFVGIHVQLPF